MFRFINKLLQQLLLFLINFILQTHSLKLKMHCLVMINRRRNKKTTKNTTRSTKDKNNFFFVFMREIKNSINSCWDKTNAHTLFSEHTNELLFSEHTNELFIKV